MSSKTANSNVSSPSDSISLIKLDELSSFGATKQNRLPALIKLNEIDQNTQIQPQQVAVNSMPTFSASELEKETNKNDIGGQRSLPAHVNLGGERMVSIEDKQRSEKENLTSVEQADESEDFQVVDMQQEDEEAQSSDVLIGPSLPHVVGKQQQQLSKDQIDKSINALQSSLQMGNSTHLGDSLIEMIINLRDENQNLIRALETNNDYVKERLSEFKRVQEEAKKREAQFAREKAEFEHQARKLQRQNSVLSERLKSMETKLKDMKLEVSESLNAASSSKASSVQGAPPELYPLIDPESFSNTELLNKSSDDNEDLHQATTMQVDATSGELYNNEQRPSAVELAAMSRESLSKHFDAKKAEFFACDDPMKQCDKLEQQLNDIGKRDYEICLMQQQLNIYRQDFRLERMEKLEAKIQIEKLKNDIDRLCLERMQSSGESGNEQTGAPQETHASGHSSRKVSDGIGRISHHLTKRAAKAAKYAAKQAHLEEKTAAALARIQAARAAASAAAQQHQAAAYASDSTESSAQQQAATTPKTCAYEGPTAPVHHHHGRHHGHHHRSSRHARGSGIRSEVVNDLLSTANKAMLTGYKMASTHVNLALDKLSQYEQQQASQLDKNKQATTSGTGAATVKPSAPMEYPSID